LRAEWLAQSTDHYQQRQPEAMIEILGVAVIPDERLTIPAA
jgi:hypothetical protein